MVPHWLLEQGISGNAIKLYLILRRYGNEERPSWPKRTTLAKVMVVSPSTVDRARDELVEVGALCYINRKSDDGDWTSNLYHVHWEPIHGCGYLTGGGRPPYTGDLSSPVNRGAPQVEDGAPPVGDGPPPVMNKERLTEPDLVNSDLDAAAPASGAAETLGQQVNRLTRTYTDAVPLSNFTAVMGIVKKAVKAGYDDDQIICGLESLAEDGRPVTTDTLRIAMDGMTPFRAERKSGAQLYDDLLGQMSDQPVAAIGGRP